MGDDGTKSKLMISANNADVIRELIGRHPIGCARTLRPIAYRHCATTGNADDRVWLRVHAAKDLHADVADREELGTLACNGGPIDAHPKRIHDIRSEQMRISNRVRLYKIVFTALRRIQNVIGRKAERNGPEEGVEQDAAEDRVIGV